MSRIHALTQMSSLDSPLVVDEDLSKRRLHSLIASDDHSPEDLVRGWHDAEMVQKVLGQMPPKTAAMLRYRFGLDDGIERTFREIGDLVGVSPESARRAVSKALAGLAENRALDPAT